MVLKWVVYISYDIQVNEKKIVVIKWALYKSYGTCDVIFPYSWNCDCGASIWKETLCHPKFLSWTMEIMEARRKVDKVVKVRLRMRRREFKALSMVEGNPLTTNIGRVLKVVNEMKRKWDHGWYSIHGKVVSTLSEKYVNLGMLVEATEELEMSLDKLLAMLKVCDKRMEKKTRTVLDHALQSKLTLDESKKTTPDMMLPSLDGAWPALGDPQSKCPPDCYLLLRIISDRMIEDVYIRKNHWSQKELGK